MAWGDNSPLRKYRYLQGVHFFSFAFRVLTLAKESDEGQGRKTLHLISLIPLGVLSDGLERTGPRKGTFYRAFHANHLSTGQDIHCAWEGSQRMSHNRLATHSVGLDTYSTCRSGVLLTPPSVCQLISIPS